MIGHSPVYFRESMWSGRTVEAKRISNTANPDLNGTGTERNHVFKETFSVSKILI